MWCPSSTSSTTSPDRRSVRFAAHHPRPGETAMSKHHQAESRAAERRQVLDELRVMPGAPANLAGRSTRWEGVGEFAEMSAKKRDAAAKELRAESLEQLQDAQELLWASDTYALLLVFQAMDAAGKDSTIEHVMTGVNPQGVQVTSFKQPSSEELDHAFLWRISKAAPERGRIGIFNRSHYEEVVALRVHPEWLDRQKLPRGDREAGFWAGRYDDINGLERHLDRNGTKIVKFFLHVSKAEQKRRFLHASTTRTSSGSSAPPTSPSEPTGTGIWPPTTTRSPPPPRRGPRGMSSRRTTSGSPRRSSRPSWSTRSVRSTYAGLRSRPSNGRPTPRHAD